jgi:hypothetical protein
MIMGIIIWHTVAKDRAEWRGVLEAKVHNGLWCLRRGRGRRKRSRRKRSRRKTSRRKTSRRKRGRRRKRRVTKHNEQSWQ